jgi:DNA-binding IclR family transcriptional regulator
VALLRSLEAGPGSLDELTRTHGWPKPSLLRLLRSLERAGLVHRDQATRRWQALMRLVSCQGAELLLRARVAGSLPALAEAIGHTVELYRFAGTTMDLIERAESQTGGVAVRARIGFQRTFDEAEAVTLIAAAYAQAPSPRRRWRWTQRATGPERLPPWSLRHVRRASPGMPNATNGRYAAAPSPSAMVTASSRAPWRLP